MPLQLGKTARSHGQRGRPRSDGKVRAVSKSAVVGLRFVSEAQVLLFVMWMVSQSVRPRSGGFENMVEVTGVSDR